MKDGLSSQFKMKDLGEAKFLLGIEIRRQPNGDVLLVQERYARDVVQRFNMEGCKSASTPLELGSKLDSSQQPSEDQEKREMESIPCGRHCVLTLTFTTLKHNSFALTQTLAKTHLTKSPFKK